MKRGEDLALSTVIMDRGSAPRTAGTGMIIRRNGEIIGTIGGGLVEADALEQASRVFETGNAVIRRFDMSGELVSGMDMICGGSMEFLVEYLPADERTVAFYEKITSIRREGGEGRIITDITELNGPGTGLPRYLLMGGEFAADFMPPQEIREALKGGAGSLKGPGILDIGERRFWVDIIADPGTIFLFGGGHVSRAVAELAQTAGFRITVLDDRAEFADGKRFPGGTLTRLIDSFDRAFDGLPVNENSYLVIVTRGHLHDQTVLRQALRSGARYIGMMGSVKKRDAIYHNLEKEGCTREDLERVRCPIGLAIGAESPEEIAVSILAELIAERAGRKK